MPEDRDQLFEKALARHLRPDGDAEIFCLDPQTLAAYHERMLSPEELASAKSHIVSCARCQEILAQLEATQEINALEGVPQHLPALTAGLKASQVGGVHHEVAPLSAYAAPVSVRAKKIVSVPPEKSFRLRWVAPAGAVAAGLLIWIGVREYRVDMRSSAPATQVAENRQQQPPPSSDSGNLKEFASPKGPERQKSEASSPDRLNELERLAPAALPPALRDEKKDSAVDKNLQALEKQLPAPRATANRSSRMSAPGPSVVAGQTQAADSIQRGDRILAGGAAQNVEAVPAPADLDKVQVQPPPPAKSVVITGAAGLTPAPPPRPADGQLQEGAGVGGTEIASTAQTSKRATYNRAVSKLGLDIRIAAPDGKKIWSVGPNGQVLHSKDSGRTWLPQFSGVSAALSSGSAPSEKVCWIAGAAGTLLRTTDGGNHWEVLHTPISGDLGGVHAADAKRASIWDAPNRLSYETSDGGATWKQTADD
jgi:hypothetical protein